MDTPIVMINRQQLQANIEAMAAFAQSQGVKLRPHIKAHKIPEIARLQLDAGAAGIAVATVGEAEGMFAAGLKDILVAVPVVTPAKLARARSLLAAGCKLSLLVDSQFGAMAIEQMKWPEGIDVLIKIDTGLGRCGLLPGKGVLDLVTWMSGRKGLRFRGLLSHAGHAYGAGGYDEVRAIGLNEGRTMVQLAEEVRRGGFAVEIISVGSTPTAKTAGSVSGVTEIRPGNYVFNDATQIALGVARPQQCSLRVWATVISRPSCRRAIIDAGAKTLGLDKGAHGSTTISGHGIMENPNWILTRLSEEHGILEGKDVPEIGTLVSIIPNHACPVVNLSLQVETDAGEVWPVALRGMTK